MQGMIGLAKRTLYDFRAENSLWRSSVAEKTGIDEKILEKYEDEGTVPEEIAEVIIREYSLPQDYFTFDPRAKELRYTPENPLKYFFKTAILWEIFVSLLFGILYVPLIALQTIFPESKSLFSAVGIICLALITAFSGIYLSTFILKRTSYSKSIVQFDFIYPYLPSKCVIVLLSGVLITSFSEENMVLNSVLKIIVSVLVLVLQSVITAFLLKTRVNPDEKENRKILGIISVLALVSYTVYAAIALTKVFEIYSAVNYAVGLVLLVSVIFGITVGIKKFPKAEILWYKILPLTAMILPEIVRVIYKFM